MISQYNSKSTWGRDERERTYEIMAKGKPWKCFVHLLMAVLGLRCWAGCSLVAVSGGCSLVAVSGGCSLVAVWRLLTAMTSFCGVQAPGTRASVVVEHGLSCSASCGTFPGQGSNPCPLNWQEDSQPPGPQGKSKKSLLMKKISYDRGQIIIGCGHWMLR